MVHKSDLPLDSLPPPHAAHRHNIPVATVEPTYLSMEGKKCLSAAFSLTAVINGTDSDISFIHPFMQPS